MIINTNSRRRARERERQNDAHGIVCALAERTNCACEENHHNERAHALRSAGIKPARATRAYACVA